MRRLSVSVDEETYLALGARASRESRSLGNLVRVLLERSLAVPGAARVEAPDQWLEEQERSEGSALRSPLESIMASVPGVDLASKVKPDPRVKGRP